MENVLYYFLTGTCMMISFFLIRFYFLVDEIRKDVKNILINEGVRNNKLDNMRDDIEDIKKERHEIVERLQHLEMEIQRIKKN